MLRLHMPRIGRPVSQQGTPSIGSSGRHGTVAQRLGGLGVSPGKNRGRLPTRFRRGARDLATGRGRPLRSFDRTGSSSILTRFSTAVAACPHPNDGSSSSDGKTSLRVSRTKSTSIAQPVNRRFKREQPGERVLVKHGSNRLVRGSGSPDDRAPGD